MLLTYPACFYPDEEQPGAYAVVVPDLPGWPFSFRSNFNGHRRGLRLGAR